MLKAVIDSTVLVSAFLAKGGISAELLREARGGTFHLCLCEEILEETQRVLLGYQRIRRRYSYSDQSVLQFARGLKAVSHLSKRLPDMRVIVRDPNDDQVIACALVAKAHYIVTRDKDLLSIGRYNRITMLTPEDFMHVLRHQTSRR